MRNQSGFTLIELVVVIIVLGILAVTAAPKFIDLQSDARASTVNGAKAAILSANALVFAKAAVNGDEKKQCSASGTTCDNITINGNSFQPEYGFLLAADLTDAVDLATTEWVVDVANAPKSGSADALIIPAGFDIAAASNAATKECYVVYTEAADADTPATAVVVDTDC